MGVVERLTDEQSRAYEARLAAVAPVSRRKAWLLAWATKLTHPGQTWTKLGVQRFELDGGALRPMPSESSAVHAGLPPSQGRVRVAD